MIDQPSYASVTIPDTCERVVVKVAEAPAQPHRLKADDGLATCWRWGGPWRAPAWI